MQGGTATPLLREGCIDKQSSRAFGDMHVLRLDFLLYMISGASVLCDVGFIHLIYVVG